MAATPGSNYTVQPNDTLWDLAQQAYREPNDWQIIYYSNTEVIGPDPDLLRSGEVIYIPLLNPRPVKTCKATAEEGIHIRTQPDTKSEIVASYPRGTILNYVNVVAGEKVGGSDLWGHSQQGHYYWMGATDHPNG